MSHENFTLGKCVNLRQNCSATKQRKSQPQTYISNFTLSATLRSDQWSMVMASEQPEYLPDGSSGGLDRARQPGLHPLQPPDGRTHATVPALKY